jgi:purine-binding chemotaxis protein CheW
MSENTSLNTEMTNSSSSKSVKRGGKFLTFFLAGEEYGLEILKVQEIIGMMPITSVPRTPPFIKGVINLRGKIIPIVDLRLKLEMEAKEQTDETCTIVVQANGVEVGLIVDKVSEVLDISDEDIEDAPAFGNTVQSDYILGIGKSEGKVKLLLDIDKVLSLQDTQVLAKTAVTGAKQLAPKDEKASDSPEDILEKAA